MKQIRPKSESYTVPSFAEVKKSKGYPFCDKNLVPHSSHHKNKTGKKQGEKSSL